MVGTVLLLFALTALPRPAIAVAVSGQVVDSVTHTPLAGANGNLFPPSTLDTEGPEAVSLASTQTLENGTFVLKAPAPGAYRLVVVTPGNHPYQLWQKVVDLPHDGIAGLTVALEPIPTFQIQPIGPDGKTVSGPMETWVWILWSDNRATLQYVDGLEKRPLLAARPGSAAAVKDALIEVRCPGVSCGSLAVDGWKPGAYRVRLAPGSEIEGRAVDDAGGPVANKHIYVHRKLPGAGAGSFQGVEDVRTGPDGAFTVPSLFPGAYELGTSKFVRIGERPLFQEIAVEGPKTPLILKPAVRNIPAWGEDIDLSSAQIVEAVFPAAKAAMTKVEGRIVDEQTHDALAGIPVRLLDRDGAYLDSGASSADGTFSLLAPGPGDYTLNTSDVAISAHAVPVRAPSARPLEVAVYVYPMLQAFVLGPDGAPAVGDGVMCLWMLWGDHQSCVRAWQVRVRDGIARLNLDRKPPPHVGKMMVEVSVDGAGYGSVTLDDWAGKTPQIRLHPAGSISGILVGPQGKPKPGTVSVFPILAHAFRACYGYHLAETDENGRFVVSGLPPGTYGVEILDNQDNPLSYQQVELGKDVARVTIQYPDHPSKLPDWDLVDHDMVPWTAVAERVDPDALRGSIEVRGVVVQKESQAPVPGVLIRLDGTDLNGPPIAAVRTGPDGAFTLSAPAGQYHLFIRGQGDYFISRPIDVQADMRPLREELERVSTFTLKILGLDGRPLAPGRVDVSLTALPNGKLPGFSTVTEPFDIPEGGAATIPASLTWTDLHPKPGQPVKVLIRVDAPGVGIGRVLLDRWPTEPVTLHLTPIYEISCRVLTADGNPDMKVRVSPQSYSADPNAKGASDRLLNSPCAFKDGLLSIDAEPGTVTLLEWESEDPMSATGGAAAWDAMSAGDQLAWGLRAMKTAVVRATHPEIPAVLVPFERPGVSWRGDEVRALISGALDPALAHWAFAQGPSWTGKPATVTGRVVSRSSGRPMPGAMALLYGPDSTMPVAAAMAGPDGRFSLHAPGRGSFQLAAGWHGVVTGEKPLTVGGSSVQPVTVRIEEEPSFETKLLSPDGKPAHAWSLSAWAEVTGPSGRTEGQPVVTRVADDQFALAPICPDEHPAVTGIDLWLEAQPVGCARVHLDRWPTGPVTVRLDAGTMLSGLDLDQAGKPVSRMGIVSATRAIQTATGVTGCETVFTVADDKGRFTIHGLFPGLYEVQDCGSATDRQVPVVLPSQEPIKLEAGR